MIFILNKNNKNQKRTGEYKLAVYHLENLIQKKIKISSNIDLENDSEEKSFFFTNYNKLFKVKINK